MQNKTQDRIHDDYNTALKTKSQHKALCWQNWRGKRRCSRSWWPVADRITNWQNLKLASIYEISWIIPLNYIISTPYNQQHCENQSGNHLKTILKPTTRWQQYFSPTDSTRLPDWQNSCITFVVRSNRYRAQHLSRPSSRHCLWYGIRHFPFHTTCGDCDVQSIYINLFNISKNARINLVFLGATESIETPVWFGLGGLTLEIMICNLKPTLQLRQKIIVNKYARSI